VSKSPANDNRSPKKPKRATAKAKNPHRARAAGLVDRLHALDLDDGEIDYGPAVDAIADLAGWAFDLAAADVADWSEGKRRVRNARRYVLARLRGKVIRSTPYEDVIFTAGLLARIFEQEIGLGVGDMVTMLDHLGLPSEVVPIVPRPQASVRIGVAPPRAHVGPVHVARVTAQPSPCAGCGFPRFRNAA
jgi:hypothetical protein